jgi:hypothetical protein
VETAYLNCRKLARTVAVRSVFTPLHTEEVGASTAVTPLAKGVQRRNKKAV